MERNVVIILADIIPRHSRDSVAVASLFFLVFLPHILLFLHQKIGYIGVFSTFLSNFLQVQRDLTPKMVIFVIFYSILTALGHFWTSKPCQILKFQQN